MDLFSPCVILLYKQNTAVWEFLYIDALLVTGWWGRGFLPPPRFQFSPLPAPIHAEYTTQMGKLPSPHFSTLLRFFSVKVVTKHMVCYRGVKEGMQESEKGGCLMVERRAAKVVGSV